MTKFTFPHYTELKKGDLWLMASGRVGHLIGTELVGTCSFLFKYDDGSLVQLYPGIPGCKDQPIVNYKFVQEELKKTQEQIDHILKTAKENIIIELINNFKEEHSKTIGMQYDANGVFIGYIPELEGANHEK